MKPLYRRSAAPAPAAFHGWYDNSDSIYARDANPYEAFEKETLWNFLASRSAYLDTDSDGDLSIFIRTLPPPPGPPPQGGLPLTPPEQETLSQSGTLPPPSVPPPKGPLPLTPPEQELLSQSGASAQANRPGQALTSDSAIPAHQAQAGGLAAGNTEQQVHAGGSAPAPSRSFGFRGNGRW